MAKAKGPAGFREYLQRLGRKGGKARLEKITPERRREIARIAGKKSAEARAKKKKAL